MDGWNRLSSKRKTKGDHYRPEFDQKINEKITCDRVPKIKPHVRMTNMQYYMLLHWRTVCGSGDTCRIMVKMIVYCENLNVNDFTDAYFDKQYVIYSFNVQMQYFKRFLKSLWYHSGITLNLAINDY